MDEKLFKTIVNELQREWGVGGLSKGIYYDFAHECTRRYVHAMTAAAEPITDQFDDSDVLAMVMGAV